MPIDFDPLFHTETMVKILREQGSTQYAMELAELILKYNPEHVGVRVILDELKEDARKAFDRFKSGGRPAGTPETSVADEPDESDIESETGEDLPQAQAADLVTSEKSGEAAAESVEVPQAPAHLTLVEPPASRPNPNKAKILRLQALLLRVQLLREAVHAPQA